MPVNIRPKGDPGGGNVVGAVLATLGTNIADPVERLAAVSASTRAAKNQLQGMTQSAILAYSGALLAPQNQHAMAAAVGLPMLTPMVYNMSVSNVPGPTMPLYVRGCRLEASYPVSIPTHACALNITMHSIQDTLNFGFVGDRDAVPHLQRLAVYTGEALADLEAAVLPAESGGRSAVAGTGCGRLRSRSDREKQRRNDRPAGRPLPPRHPPRTTTPAKKTATKRATTKAPPPRRPPPPRQPPRHPRQEARPPPRRPPPPRQPPRRRPPPRRPPPPGQPRQPPEVAGATSMAMSQRHGARTGRQQYVSEVRAPGLAWADVTDCWRGGSVLRTSAKQTSKLSSRSTVSDPRRHRVATASPPRRSRGKMRVSPGPHRIGERRQQCVGGFGEIRPARGRLWPQPPTNDLYMSRSACLCSALNLLSRWMASSTLTPSSGWSRSSSSQPKSA